MEWLFVLAFVAIGVALAVLPQGPKVADPRKEWAASRKHWADTPKRRGDGE